MKMSKNAEKLYDNAEAIIKCGYCDKSEGSSAMDSVDLAFSADAHGWLVNRSGKVKCPKCVKKMKRS